MPHIPEASCLWGKQDHMWVSSPRFPRQLHGNSIKRLMLFVALVFWTIKKSPTTLFKRGDNHIPQVMGNQGQSRHKSVNQDVLNPQQLLYYPMGSLPNKKFGHGFPLHLLAKQLTVHQEPPFPPSLKNHCVTTYSGQLSDDSFQFQVFFSTPCFLFRSNCNKPQLHTHWPIF